jgi:hypothetical protein
MMMTDTSPRSLRSRIRSRIRVPFLAPIAASGSSSSTAPYGLPRHSSTGPGSGPAGRTHRRVRRRVSPGLSAPRRSRRAPAGHRTQDPQPGRAGDPVDQRHRAVDQAAGAALTRCAVVDPEQHHTIQASPRVCSPLARSGVRPSGSAAGAVAAVTSTPPELLERVQNSVIKSRGSA